jgi:TonB family protein
LKFHDTIGFCGDLHNATFLRDSVELAFAQPYCTTTVTWYYNERNQVQTDSASFRFKEVVKTSVRTNERLHARYDSTGLCIDKYFVFSTNDTVILTSARSSKARLINQKSLWKNLRYPASAREGDVHGTVLVGFRLSEKGEVIGAEPVLGEKNLADEAVRVVSLIKSFSPAMRDGKPVSSYVIMPITFQLGN